MSMRETFNIAGGWLGTYYYRGTLRISPPVRFEAAFTVDSNGSFGGTILDDSRLLGMADVRGIQSGLSVRFSKTYHKRIVGGRTFLAEYEGALSDDGHVLSGRWRAIGPYGMPVPGAHGTWEAHRAWHSEEEPEAV